MTRAVDPSKLALAGATMGSSFGASAAVITGSSQEQLKWWRKRVAPLDAKANKSARDVRESAAFELAGKPKMVSKSAHPMFSQIWNPGV
jgi:hypothetical protein